MPPVLDIDLLRTLVAFADSGSFSRAALLVHRSQSAVSMQMKRLEALLGRPLFARSGRDVVLTDDGIRLLNHARRLLALHEAALRDFAAPAISGKVRIGIPDDYLLIFLPQLFQQFAERHPEVTTEVICDTSEVLLRRLGQGALDLAIAAVREPEDDAIVLRREKILWVGSPRHPTHEKRPLPLAVFAVDTPIRRAVDRALGGGEGGPKGGPEIEYRIVLSSKSWTAVAAAVRSGFAVSAMAGSVVDRSFRVLSEQDGFPAMPEFSIVMKRVPGAPSEAGARLAAEILDGFRTPSPSTI